MTRLSRKRSPLFRFLGRHLADNFILPTKRLLLLLLIGGIIVLSGFFFGESLLLFWVYNGCLLVFSIIDLLLLPKRKQIVVRRHMPEAADLLQPIVIHIEMESQQGQPIGFSLLDDLPLSFTAMQPINGKLREAKTTVTYTTTAKERGKYTFSHLYVRYWGGIGLWQKQYKISQEQEIKILPDLTAVRGYLASMQQSLILEGRKVVKKVKTGSEFHGIREYVTDDDPRYVNWSASARTGRLMTNVYQPERGKVLTLLIDCGRMMGVELDNKVKLDRTLEAALTLAAVALRQGDQVAVLAFSNDIKSYIPPGRGLAHLHQIIEAVYDLKSEFVESNYSLALEHIHRYQKKRSMLVLFSDMESYLFEDQLAPYLMRLRRTHMVLLLALRDPLLHEWMSAEVTNSDIAYTKSVAYKFTLDRKEYTRKMASMGIQVLDVPADQLALSAVNFYLEVRSRDAL